MSDEQDERFEFITTEDILAELMRRFDNVVIGAMGSLSDLEDKQQIAYNGEFAICTGLAAKLLHTLNVDWEDSRKNSFE